MKFADVAENVGRLLVEMPSSDEFIYEFLLAYGSPKARVARLKQGAPSYQKIPGKKMAQLCDPNKMPDGLRTAHHNLYLPVDRLYRTKLFASDEERLEHLFKLYEEMAAMEKLV
ncbi:hypothetical protein PDESU_01192 [Pontiella desulfatans]|uniref:MmeI-like C-terminal domain-containing protein n=1 Tax=Pontiella desulfatans TaxID=2750659 RepID=A0A6C2TYH0_PONDE|nr:hypothetical protein PDESU_01192 [Pontiella desulfatans]